VPNRPVVVPQEAVELPGGLDDVPLEITLALREER
jgi:hypothetical protein